MEVPKKQHLSYLSNPRDRPYVYETMIDVLWRRTEKFPNKEIFVQHDIDGFRKAITYKELMQHVLKFSKFLISKGVKKGDFVALFGPNSIEVVIAQFAIMMAGAVAVNVAMSIKDGSDVLNIFLETDCKAFLFDPGRKMELHDPILQLLKTLKEKNPKVPPVSNDGDSDPLIVLLRAMDGASNYPTLQTALESEEPEVRFPTLFSEDVIAVFTTSGSTGKPKMVPHTHFSFANIPIPDDLGFKDSTLYNDRPFAWLGGSPFTTIMLGETRIFTDASVTIGGEHTDKIWNIIKTEKCESALLMPYFIGDLLSKKDEYKDPFKLKFVLTGGQMLESFNTQTLGIFAESMVVAYASTESVTVSVGKLLKEGDQMESGYIGTLGLGLEMKLIDEDGHVTALGEEGEICVRSPILFNGYINNDEATKAAFLPGNWFRSGDLGIFKDDGSIIIKGRVKNIVSRGTRKIMPDAVEDIILKMDGILRAAVVAVPDKRLYEEVCACFVVKGGFSISEKDVETYCSERMLKKQTLDGLGDIPTYYLKFESFPRLLTGKIDKISIKGTAIERLNLNE
ncbi:hypothetical protein FSP39_002997 [Pinctada imbricata]|uniref:Uncharacterized protein n=1 Tax=Pinctada imbricata TaxID=66713 RepID=A0AA88YDJ6_PINIB|nr:hypothetical protein FSP39_002997 [Pinctada imbricata]